MIFLGRRRDRLSIFQKFKQILPDFMIYKEMDGNRDVIMTKRRSSDNVLITKTWS